MFRLGQQLKQISLICKRGISYSDVFQVFPSSFPKLFQDHVMSIMTSRLHVTSSFVNNNFLTFLYKIFKIFLCSFRLYFLTLYLKHFFELEKGLFTRYYLYKFLKSKRELKATQSQSYSKYI